MPDILSVIAKYGYSSLFATLLAEAIGLPIVSGGSDASRAGFRRGDWRHAGG
jgi:hypothetical protein